MCALDRSSDGTSSQSLKGTLFHIKSIYHTSPVAVCVRSEQHKTLYSNKSFQYIYDFIQSASNETLFSVGPVKLDYVLAQFELDCMFSGKGCVLNKNFYCGDILFQIRLECLNIQGEGLYAFWQINLPIQFPLSTKLAHSGNATESDTKFNALISTLPVQNIEAISFSILGFSYADSASYLNIPISTVRKRVERTREVIKGYFSSYEEFIGYVYKSKKIFFFVDYVSEIISVKRM